MIKPTATNPAQSKTEGNRAHLQQVQDATTRQALTRNPQPTATNSTTQRGNTGNVYNCNSKATQLDKPKPQKIRPRGWYGGVFRTDIDNQKIFFVYR